MNIKELNFNEKLNKEVLHGLMDLEVLVLNDADKELILAELKKMKMKYNEN